MEKQNIYKAVLLIMMMPVLLQGCKKDNTQELKDQEIRFLTQYLADNNITQEPTASGLYYIEIEEGTGGGVAAEYIVDFEYTTKLVDGSFIGTSDEDLAREKDIFSETIMYGPIRMMVGFTGVPGLDEGLTYMKENGIAEMILPSDINGMGGSATGYSPSYSTHIYSIELINSFTDPEKFQNDQIVSYLAENDFDSVYVTETGLHYIELQAGLGEFIKNGDIVDLWYTGSFIDGRVFDSNENDGGTIMTVDMPATNYIDAWDEALKLMKPGTRAKIIVPYGLGYGPSGTGPIPPYMPLIFDIDIDKVTPL